MSLKDLHKILQAGTLPNLVLMYGHETYFIDKGVLAVQDAIVSTESRDFNLNLFQGKDMDAVAVVEQARTYPAFAPQRLIIIKDIHEAKAEQLDGLLEYIEDPVPETILLVTADKIDARRRFYQLFKKQGLVYEFKKIYENQLPAFVRDLAKENKINLTADALRLFCKRVGTNLNDVQGQMEKLLGYLGEKEIAEEGDVAAIVSDARVESIFELTDAMGEGNQSLAITLLIRLINEGQAPLMILAMIVRHFRQMWKITALTAQNVPQKEFPRQVGVSPYFLKGLIQQAARFDNDQYQYLFERFLQTDLAIKSSGSEPRLQLEFLVLEIAALNNR